METRIESITPGGSEFNELSRLVQQRVDLLPAGLQAHIYRVRDMARQLAHRHGIDEEMAALGMLAHDVARAMSDKDLLDRANDLGLPIGLVERQLPLLLHGPVGAEILQREDGLTDQSLYRAVYWHTTAHPSLDELGKVVFLADKLDPEKIVYYPYLPQLRKLAMEDLDRGLLAFLNWETAARLNRGELVHPESVVARNSLLAASTAKETSAKRP